MRFYELANKAEWQFELSETGHLQIVIIGPEALFVEEENRKAYDLNESLSPEEHTDWNE